MATHVRIRLVVSAAVVLTFSTVVHAADPCASLKKQGDQAMDELRYDDALVAYEGAYECRPDPPLLYNRGRAFGALGRFPEALEDLLTFRAEAPPRLLSRVPGLDQFIDAMRQKVSLLEIRANVEGAQVRVRGEVIGTTPLPAPVTLNAGDAKVEVTLDGHVPWQQNVELPGAGKLVQDVTLRPIDLRGVVVIRSPVRGARVRLDGRDVGMVPVETAIAPGSHRIRLTHPDYEVAETSVVVETGRRKSLKIDLDERLRLLERWWFWAGVGTVVVGGIVIAVAATSEGSPGSGDIPPGRLAVPLTAF